MLVEEKGSLVSYYVKDSAGNSFHDPTWTGPTMDRNTVRSLDFVIDGKAFTFQLGNSYAVIMIDSRNAQYGFSIIPGVSLESSIRNTSLNATLNLVNHGPQTTTFTAYGVKDPQGHCYNNTNWDRTHAEPRGSRCRQHSDRRTGICLPSWILVYNPGHRLNQHGTHMVCSVLRTRQASFRDSY